MSEHGEGGTAREGPGPRAGWVRRRRDDVVDVFVYVVVLNLAVEYFPSVISEGFTLSLLTAVFLKVALELVLSLKARFIDRFRGSATRRGKMASAFLIWLVAVGSKIVVLELVDLIFGDTVSLGGFVAVSLLVLALLTARRAVRRLLGDVPSTA